MIIAHPSATCCLTPKSHISNERLAAPRTSGETLVEPPLGAAAELAAANRRIIEASDYDLQGRRLAELAARAREELIGRALRYTRSYREVAEPIAPSGPLFVAGHQPEMFHPGVWLKNFVLDRLARDHGGVAVNLVVDSDTIKSSSLRVPGGTVDSPTVEGVLIDRPSAEIPFQARTIQDQALFESFGRRAAERLAALVPDPLVKDYWPLAVECSRRTRNLGECLAQSRHQWEARWGLETLEIPQSSVCNLEAFEWLAAHLLAHLPRFWEVYNSALADYRRCYHVRSQSHPAPELAADESWLEAPFWIWTDEDPRRRRVFARQRGGEILLSDRQRIEVPLTLSPESEADGAVEQLATLGGRGIHLRSRALLTTLAARLVFGDLFLHGIGGAKYDRLTDAIIERFFGIEAPDYMVVSGTLHLPIARHLASSDDFRAVERELRELTFHPERFLDGSGGTGSSAPGGTGKRSLAEGGTGKRSLAEGGTGKRSLAEGGTGKRSLAEGGTGKRSLPVPEATATPAEWIEQKQHWISAPFAPSQARERCRAIRSANEHLQPWIVARRDEALLRAKQLARQLRAETILAARDYGFCLHPEKSLREFLLAFPAATV